MDDLGVPMGTPISGNHQMGFDKPSMIPVFNAAKNEEQWPVTSVKTYEKHPYWNHWLMGIPVMDYYDPQYLVQFFWTPVLFLKLLRYLLFRFFSMMTSALEWDYRPIPKSELVLPLCAGIRTIAQITITLQAANQSRFITINSPQDLPLPSSMLGKLPVYHSHECGKSNVINLPNWRMVEKSHHRTHKKMLILGMPSIFWPLLTHESVP